MVCYYAETINLLCLVICYFKHGWQLLFTVDTVETRFTYLLKSFKINSLGCVQASQPVICKLLKSLTVRQILVFKLVNIPALSYHMKSSFWWAKGCYHSR